MDYSNSSNMYKHYIFFIFFFGVVTNCLCQTIPINTTIYTPNGSIHQTSYIQFPQMRNLPTNSSNYKYRKSPKIDERLEIVLTNGDTIRLAGTFNTKDSIHYLNVNRYVKKKIMPRDTKVISRYVHPDRKITGIATDSCWLFKVEEGRINSYSYFPDEFPSRVVAIQKSNNGPILPCTKQNLLAIISDDPDIVEIVEEGLFRKAIDTYNNGH